jgi:hypothetical protein
MTNKNPLYSGFFIAQIKTSEANQLVEAKLVIWEEK